MNHNPDERGFGQRLCDATEVPRLELRGFHYMKGKQQRQSDLSLSVLAALTEPPTTSNINGISSARPCIVALRKGPVRGWDRRATESIAVDLHWYHLRNHPAQRSFHFLNCGMKQDHRKGCRERS
jgi:hypothetical protein